MTYTRVWSNSIPLGTDQSRNADDDIRNLRLDIDQRLSEIVGGITTLVGRDPIVTGSTVLSLVDIAASLLTKPSINATNNVIPRRTAAGVLSDSAISDNSTTVSISRPAAFAGAVTAASTLGVTGLSTLGIITSATQPRFLAQSAATQIFANSATTPVLFATERFDVGGGFDAASTYTVPSAGLYLFGFTLGPRISAGTHDYAMAYTVEFTTTAGWSPLVYTGSSSQTGVPTAMSAQSATVLVPCSLNDTCIVNLTVHSGSTSVLLGATSTFWGVKLA